MEEWTPPAPFPRPTKEKRAMGVSKDPNEPRTKLKFESKKQHVRKGTLRQWREAILAEMHRKTGGTWCMMKGQFGIKCNGRLDLEHVIPAGRHEQNRDSKENFGIACRAHHNHKTRTPGLYDFDYRNEADKKLVLGCRI